MKLIDLNYTSFLEAIKKEKRKHNIYSVILITAFIIAITICLILENYAIGFTSILLLIYLIFCFIRRNTSFKNDLKELDKFSNEINNTCMSYKYKYYFTREHIILIKMIIGKLIIIPVKEIEKFDYTNDEGTITLTIKLTNDKKLFLPGDKNLVTLFKEYLEDIPTTNNNIEGKHIKSEHVEDFILYKDYAEGKIYIPAINKSVYQYFDNADENTIEYAEYLAIYVLTFNKSDIRDALISSVSAYNSELKSIGYSFFNEEIPLKVDETNILNYMELSSVFVKTLNDKSKALTICFDAPWEPEHGFKWVFKEKELIYAGSGNTPYSDAEESLLDLDINFVINKHPKVTLTEEEYIKLEK